MLFRASNQPVCLPELTKTFLKNSITVTDILDIAMSVVGTELNQSGMVLPAGRENFCYGFDDGPIEQLYYQSCHS